MSKHNPFRSVRALHPARSVFDLSYSKLMTCDMGQLIPVMCDEVVPGDIWQVGNESVVRFQPLVAPILHEINQYVHYFFVPYRILWEDWEEFITGGIDGESEAVLPRWTDPNTEQGSLWDFLGFPVGITPAGALPIDFPRRAYNLVYNEYYRDETLQDEVAEDNQIILNRNWSKDYFTSSLPWQQRGVSPALPIEGTSHAIWSAGIPFTFTGSAVWPAGGSALSNMAHNSPLPDEGGGTRETLNNNSVSGGGTITKASLDNNTVDLSSAITFDISDLRLAWQIQKWLERNARAGVRYKEFLISQFGTSPRDDRLQRPEYIGGSKSPIIVSEVLQTSSTDATTPQGNMAGHGISVSQAFAGKYRAEEFGLIIGIMSVMPVPMYQQGIDRQWLRRSRYDFPFPVFVNLSEQAIEQAEIYATNVEADNTKIFGYQGRYDELRIKHNTVVSQMRDLFDYWHLGRKFTSAPLLNSDFIKCVPRKDVFAVPSEPGLIVSFGNLIKAIRPIPIQAEPGLVDHN